MSAIRGANIAEISNTPPDSSSMVLKRRNQLMLLFLVKWALIMTGYVSLSPKNTYLSESGKGFNSITGGSESEMRVGGAESKVGIC